MKIVSIRFKMLSALLSILMITFVLVVLFVFIRQREVLLSETDRTIALNSDTLIISLQKLMLEGEAPIVVETMDELNELSEFKNISVIRTNGNMAFSDYTTLEFVNQYQDEIFFDETERLVDDRTDDEWRFVWTNVSRVIGDQSKLVIYLTNEREVEHYYPILNQRSCMVCHGSDHIIRGIARIGVSISGVYTKIEKNRNFLIILFVILSVFLIIILFFMIRGLILSPILKIENTVSEVGKGNYLVRVPFTRNDEIGNLADRVNQMIVNVEERFKLSKFVSHSTEDLIRSGAELDFKAEKKMITVLFSDIRSFTSYSESHPPEEVIEQLNKILQIQTEIVHREGGDIDKFVGDEIMAIFPDEYHAVLAGVEMVRAVEELKLKSGSGLQIGIGINCGEVVAGNIGNANRLEYAVIGDTVNVASRLCSIAKGGTVLITEPGYEAVKEHVKADKVENHIIKGKSQAVNFYVVHSISRRHDVNESE